MLSMGSARIGAHTRTYMQEREEDDHDNDNGNGDNVPVVANEYMADCWETQTHNGYRTQPPQNAWHLDLDDVSLRERSEASVHGDGAGAYNENHNYGAKARMTAKAQPADALDVEAHRREILREVMEALADVMPGARPRKQKNAQAPRLDVQAVVAITKDMLCGLAIHWHSS